jgi:hypothetical protein
MYALVTGSRVSGLCVCSYYLGLCSYIKSDEMIEYRVWITSPQCQGSHPTCDIDHRVAPKRHTLNSTFTRGPEPVWLRPAAATRRAVRLLPSLADRRPVLAGRRRPAADRLVRDYFGMHRIDTVDEVVFQLPYGEWIRLFRANGLEILDLIEPRPAPDAVSSYRDDEDRAWARRWPAECIWRLRRV